MRLIAPTVNSTDIIALQPVKKMIGINPMVLSAHWNDSIYIIALNIVNNTWD